MARDDFVRSWLLKTEAAAVFGLDRAVSEDLDRENEVAGGAGVVEVSFAGDELGEVLDQHFGDFNLCFALGGVGDENAAFVAPRGHHPLKNGVLEDGKGSAGFGHGGIIGVVLVK